MNCFRINKKGSITLETMVFLPMFIVFLFLIISVMRFDTDYGIIDNIMIDALREINDLDTRIQLVGIDDIYENILSMEEVEKIIEDVEMFDSFNIFSEGGLLSDFIGKFEMYESDIGNNFLYENILIYFYKKSVQDKIKKSENIYNNSVWEYIEVSIELTDDRIVARSSYQYPLIERIFDYNLSMESEKSIRRYDISGLDIIGILKGLGDKTVYITKTGKKYHVEDCDYLKKSKIPIKLKDLNKDEYKPCKLCIEKKVYGGLKYHGNK